MLPARIVVFGSSSVYGRGDPERGGFVGRLRSWHEPIHSGNLVYNLGIGGDTTSGMLKRFEAEVSARRPDLVIIYPGLNDSRRENSHDSSNVVSPKQFQDNINSLLLMAKKFAPTVFVSSFPLDETRTLPFRDTKLFYRYSDAATYTRLSRDVCDNLCIPYLDIFERWSNLTNFKDLSIDGLHGTPDAHEKLSLELRQFLLDTFKP